MSERRFKTMGEAQAYVLSQRGGVFHLIVLHDSWCRGPTCCNCDADYVVKPATAEGLIEAARLAREFLKDRPS